MNRRLALLALGVAISWPSAWADPDTPCRVGVQLHLRFQESPEASYLRHARAFVEGGMADYALLVAQGLSRADREKVAAYLAGRGVPFLIQDTLLTPRDAMARSAPERRYTAEDYARLREVAGDRFLGAHWGELDSSGLEPRDWLPLEALGSPTRKRVKEALLEYLRVRVERFHRECGIPFAHSSALLTHALFAEAGVDILCSEIGENIPNVEMMVASNRGAARAYDRPWMIDFSTWWAPRGNAGEQVSPREGHTPWCLFSALAAAAFGGADYAQLEVDWAALDADYRLLPWGRALKTLVELVRHVGPVGETETRFAVLLGHENGWPGVGWRIGDVRGTGLFDGIRHEFMQTRDADLSLKILDVFYPGFERCGWDPEYPGFLAESPLGTLDLVPDNLASERYDRYAVLVALGYHRITPEISSALRAYVERGGVLVCGDTLFLDEFERPVDGAVAEPLIGCMPDFGEEHLVKLDWPASALDAIPGFAEAAQRDEWRSHWLHPVPLTTGTVVARFDEVPYIVENRIGKGRVFLITALNLVGNDAERHGQEPFLYANLLYAFLHTLEQDVGDGVTLTPWNGLEHILTHRSDGSRLLLVMNHGDMACRRDAAVRNVSGLANVRVFAQGTWEGLEPGTDVAAKKTSGNTLEWTFELPAKSLTLFELR